MALWHCTACSTAYAVGAARCPQCGATEHTEGPVGSSVPSVTVACATSGCAHEGTRRRLMLRSAAPGVLERPPLVCAACRAHLVELLPDAPTHTEEDTTMPKITAHGGATNAADPQQGASAEGGEESSPGSSSSTSSETPPPSSEPSETARRSTARKTGNRSGKGRTDSSTAPSTDGGLTAATSDDGE